MFYITGNVLETSMKITTPPRITGEHWTLSGWRALLKFMTRTCTDVWLLHLFTSLFILMLFEGSLDFESCENWYCYVITTWRLTLTFFSENLPGVMPLSLSLKMTECIVIDSFGLLEERETFKKSCSYKCAYIIITLHIYLYF